MKKAIFIPGILAGAMAVTAIAVTAADARPGGPRGMMPFEEIDANDDGQITRDEIEAHARARFDAADTDGDGLLSADEMSAAAMARMQARIEARTARMLERMDDDGDGMLSPDEMQRPEHRMGRMFDRFDGDGDGAITREEIEEARGEMRKGRKMRGKGHGWGHGGE